jgi:hydroxymethylpyrimidine pyrophosphatase-like HAD family hydrolase
MQDCEVEMRLIAVDMDGTLLGPDGQVSERNMAAVRAAEQAGVEVVVATGRRHSYAMRVMRGLGFREESALISSNGTVTRTVGAKLMDRTLLPVETARWLCGHVDEFRNALVMTFDKVREDGDDERGALVVEHFEELHGSIGRWMTANEPYILHVVPIEKALEGDAPIQMMLCGTVERMRRAEARMLEHPGVSAVGVMPLWRAEVRRPNLPGDGIAAQERTSGVAAALHRTEYLERDLSIVDILPAGCSKGAALLRLAETRGIQVEEILAIGDNWNDVSMLEVAGRAVLMANAPDELKVMAKERGWAVGRRFDEDGVAEAIEAALTGGMAVTQ